MSRTPRKDLGQPGAGSLEELLRGVIHERDELVQEVRQLTRFQDTSSMWQQFGATTRQLRRAEEELALSRQSETAAEAELARTSALCEEQKERISELESRAQQQSILVTVLREELRKSNLAVLDLEETRQQLHRELATSRQALALAEEAHASDVALLEESKCRLVSNSDPVSDRVTQTSPPPSPGNAALAADLAALADRLEESERLRRGLLNTVHELRGNVRVMARVRPRLHHDGDDSCLNCLRDGQSVELTGTSRGAGQTFSLDAVFGPEVGQDAVYREVAELVQSAIDGYKVCILSYGQTGSGKTHTMTGGDGASRGLVPRAVEALLSRMEALSRDGSEATLSLSILEIYNEALHDLLVGRSGAEDRVKVALLGDKVIISGLSSRALDTSSLDEGMRQFREFLDAASAARSVANTLMNDASSRSHMIFMLDLRIRHANSGDTFLGGLRFVDLAGSERLDRTGTASDANRLRETVNINKSLSCLGDVFSAIGSKQSHGTLFCSTYVLRYLQILVPFRNSKLTTVLQDCLSGSGKALLIVSLNPATSSAAESLCSLRFASQLNRVELGKAAKHFFVDSRTVSAQLDSDLTKAVDPPNTRPHVSANSLESERSRPMKRRLPNQDPDPEVENRPRNLCVGQFPVKPESESRQHSQGPRRLLQAPSGYPRESVFTQSYSFASGLGRSVSTIERKKLDRKINRAANTSSWR